ncbi:hypothetical protein PR202_ga29396 [Eleusine coracana subsp. coracana]|uniref:DUF6598 domain-containing protein n=1 Tax=Eleusine coracana subsp. coracana TaxID=191504 RepID=A0AAV5DL19_ELECO|nr:hypothetical protein PR202_ga29396 [Eleusine coracana subsp. coracana]
MEGNLESSINEGLSTKRDRPGPQERSFEIQKRLEELEEKIKGFGGWSELPEMAKEQWRESTRVALKLEYERPCSGLEDEIEDDEESQALKYRNHWTSVWGHLGDFEDATEIGPKRFWLNHEPQARPYTTIQVFSAKIVRLSEGLRFPLDVYGTIAARDCVDRRRNIIFSHLRDNCQTITEQDPYLLLTGPSRAIVLLDPVFMEVMLKVKGAVECEDKILNFQVDELAWSDTGYSRVRDEHYKSKHSTLNLVLGTMDLSVEACISVRPIGAPLPAAFLVTAKAGNSNPDGPFEDIDSKKIILFDSRHASCPFDSTGFINLSRAIVSVRVTGNLTISIETPEKVLHRMTFPARKKERMRVAKPYFPDGDVGPGLIEVVVIWSPLRHH